MSRLRRPFLYDRYIFVTVKLAPSRALPETSDYERLAASLARIRRKHRFAITAWVFLSGRTADLEKQVCATSCSMAPCGRLLGSDYAQEIQPGLQGQHRTVPEGANFVRAADLASFAEVP